MKKGNNNISSIIKNGNTIQSIKKGLITVYEAWKNLLVNGIPPLTLKNCKSEELIDYKVYGDSKQDGTPSPEIPVEIESVGDKTGNLIPYPYRDSTMTINGVTFTDNGDGTVTANGTATEDANAAFYCHQWSNINIPAGTYTFKANPLENTDANGNRLGQGAIALRKDGNVIVNTGDYGKGQTFTIDGADQIYVALRINAGMTADNLVFKPQLELGEIATDYEPHGYKIPIKVSDGTNETITNIYLDKPLRKVGDIADYIDFESKKVVRNISDYTITGQEDWTIFDTTIGRYGFQFFDNFVSLIKGLCTHYKVSDSWAYLDNYMYIGLNNKFLYIVDNHNTIDGVSNLEDFKSYLQTLNIKVIYISQTPTEETIKIPNIPTMKGTCILSVDTETQPSNMEVIYKGKP